MSADKKQFPRGAEWRRWDLHIHTPASQLGNPFPGVTWDSYVDGLEKAAAEHHIAVIGVTDYMTIDGYERLLSNQKDPEKPRLNSILLIPNIEFRCSPQTKDGSALNIHLLIDATGIGHVEKIKKSLRNLRITYNNQSYGCIHDELIDFAKAQNPALQDDAAAYKVGIEQFKPSHTEIFKWLDNDSWLKMHSVVGIANGKDGISGLPLDSFSATRDELLRQSHFVFSGNPADRLHYLGLKDSHPASEIKRQYNSLKPCLHGSDAHSLEKIFVPDMQRYCWIKADPTFLGLLQAIKEPADRAFIGELPEKLREVAENKTFFIDSINVQKNEDSTIPEEWLAGCRVQLNHGLVAIIGNKGSGKSALADVIALLGNSQQKEHFSFLQKNRFRGKSGYGDPAKQFTGKLEWLDKSQEVRRLSDDPADDKVQLVRYIPQGHFENLCNDHIAGRAGAFEKELRAVIFDYAGGALRLGALDFDQLIEQQESGYRDQLGEYRKDLARVNLEIENIEAQAQPQVKRTLLEILALKNRQIEEHNSIKPVAMPKPSEQLSSDELKAVRSLEEITENLKKLEVEALSNVNSQASFAAKSKAIQAIRERLRTLEKQYKQFQDDTAKDLEILGVKLHELATLSVKQLILDEVSEKIPQEQQSLVEKSSQNEQAKKDLYSQQSELKTKLNEPQLLYQHSLKAIEVWEEKLLELTGTSDAPETLKGIENRIAQLDELPVLLENKQEQRRNLTGDIFDILNAQRKAREDLFKPVQDLIQGNKLIIDEYKLQFQATLGGSSDALSSPLFALIKQNSGEFRGDDEGPAVVKRLSEQFDLNQKADVLSFVNELDTKIHAAALGGKADAIGIASMLRKDMAAKNVYDLLYGLSYLEPRYSLLFQDTKIEQLSPGQRGALLLIFYLLVDKGRDPIILDQPEENLDNETVVSLLVPVLTEAKKKRQIIMVTHNPNLAVVCDAEQVIYSSFNRKNASKIEYVSGSIENPIINSHVVNVLEGTKFAFDNRGSKYHD
ncbi:TrlF family AAA-like ATPase [Methylobacter svalbardensis]|uniref:TrlF family AAA-like ATPase n=1 Tax=Methylobacter svalbardensis TaxID=3080016 RepID=UPI0030EBAB9C